MGIGPGSGNDPSLASTIRVSVVGQKSSTGVSAAETLYSTCLFGAALSLCGYVDIPRRRRLLARGEKGTKPPPLGRRVIISQGTVSLESNKQSKQVM